MVQLLVGRSTRRLAAATLGGCTLLAGATVQAAPKATAPKRAQPAAGVVLLVQNPPPHGLVLARVDLTAAARQCQALPVRPHALQATAGGQRLPLQFVPDPDFDDQQRVVGTLVLRWTGSGDGQVRLLFDGGAAPAGKPEENWDGTVRTKFVTITHDARRLGGFPSRVVFADTQKTLDNFTWNDRLHHREQRGFFLTRDSQAQVKRVSEGALCTVVRVRGRYLQAEGKQPQTEPEATYDWYYFNELPLVWVRATIRQRESFAWHECHFLELYCGKGSFPQWVGGDAQQQGEFGALAKLYRFPSWGAFVDGRNAIAMFAGGQILVYDGADKRAYLHAQGDIAWKEWGQKDRQFAAWLWMGTATDPIAAVRGVLTQLPTNGTITVSSPAVQAQAEEQRKR